MNAHRFFHAGFILVLILSLAGAVEPAGAQEPMTVLWACASNNRIGGVNWPANQAVQIGIDDPATPQGPDFSATQSTDASGNLNYWSPYDIGVGSVISVTAGSLNKQVIVSAFEVTGFDPEADTISGTGTPNTGAAIWVFSPNDQRPFMIGPSGQWQVDLHGVVDLAPWSHGFAMEQDSGGNGTQSFWPTNTIQALVDRPGNSVEGYEWTLGSPVTLTIDNPGNGTGIDFMDTQAPAINPWEASQVTFELAELRLEPGAVLTMTNGITTTTHTVAYLDLTGIDTAAERVTGKASPGSTVQVEFQHDFRRYALADQAGDWMADFSTPGPGAEEQTLFDIEPGMGLSARQYSAGGNSTRLYWMVPDYKAIAYPDEDVIAATDFWPGSTVTITVDDPENGAGVDLLRTGQVDTQTGGWNCQDWWGFCSVLDLRDEFDVHAGQLITISDGIHTVSHVVTSLQITFVDWTTSTVYGTAPAGSEVRLDLWPSCGQRRVLADAQGRWQEDFSLPGDEASEQQTCHFSADPLRDIVAYQGTGGGETWVGRYATPRIEARYHENTILAYNWPLDTPVTLTIDDPGTPDPVDYTRTLTSGIAPWNVNETIVEFRLDEEAFELENGQRVSVSDGTTAKIHIVAVPTITDVDRHEAIVEGLAAPFAEVWLVLNIRDDPGFAYDVTRHEIADATGHWLTNFGIPGDENFETKITYIDCGEEGDVRIRDEDGDSTATNWGTGLLMLELASDGSPQQHVYTRHWPGRQPVTLLIDDPATPQNPDYMDSQRMMYSDGFSHRTIDWTGHFEVRPGFTITVTDGYVARSMMVPLLRMTGYDLANDTISGRAYPFTTVVVPISNADGSAEYAERSVMADINGNWLANFAVSNNPDEVIYDVRPGDGVEAQVYDADGDHTVLRDWNIPVAWTLRGFYQPVDMNSVYNLVKGGSTVPFKFEVFAGATELTSTATVASVVPIQISCDSNASTDQIETTVSGGTNLRYDTTAGQFVYSWKTPSNPGRCYRITMTALDGSSLAAYFKLR